MKKQSMHLLLYRLFITPSNSSVTQDGQKYLIISCSSLSQLICHCCYSRSVTADCRTKTSEYAQRLQSKMCQAFSSAPGVEIYKLIHFIASCTKPFALDAFTNAYWSCMYFCKLKYKTIIVLWCRQMGPHTTWVALQVLSQICINNVLPCN